MRQAGSIEACARGVNNQGSERHAPPLARWAKPVLRVWNHMSPVWVPPSRILEEVCESVALLPTRSETQMQQGR